MDGFFAIFFFPCLEKAVKVGGVVFQVFGDDVEEMAEIRTLAFGLVQTEHLADGLHKVGQWERAEVVELGGSGKSGRKPFTEGGGGIAHVSGKQDVVIIQSLVLDIVGPGLGEKGFAEQVLFI